MRDNTFTPIRCADLKIDQEDLAEILHSEVEYLLQTCRTYFGHTLTKNASFDGLTDKLESILNDFAQRVADVIASARTEDA